MFRSGVLAGAGGGIMIGVGMLELARAVLATARLAVARDVAAALGSALFVAGFSLLRRENSQL